MLRQTLLKSERFSVDSLIDEADENFFSRRSLVRTKGRMDAGHAAIERLGFTVEKICYQL